MHTADAEPNPKERWLEALKDTIVKLPWCPIDLRGIDAIDAIAPETLLRDIMGTQEWSVAILQLRFRILEARVKEMLASSDQPSVGDLISLMEQSFDRRMKIEKVIRNRLQIPTDHRIFGQTDLARIYGAQDMDLVSIGMALGIPDQVILQDVTQFQKLRHWEDWYDMEHHN